MHLIVKTTHRRENDGRAKQKWVTCFKHSPKTFGYNLVWSAILKMASIYSSEMLAPLQKRLHSVKIQKPEPTHSRPWELQILDISSILHFNLSPPWAIYPYLIQFVFYKTMWYFNSELVQSVQKVLWYRLIRWLICYNSSASEVSWYL
jgi:hypothetical protein